jgi:predicted GNAT family acetyltransferase
MLVAEFKGNLIGKINTNAVTFTRYQVGGVYVHPDYRGMGIARRMAGEFIASLTTQGKGISLFVKKSNSAARRVYQRIGFEILGDYHINYY